VPELRDSVLEFTRLGAILFVCLSLEACVRAAARGETVKCSR
jgi:hypothetical protein